MTRLCHVEADPSIRRTHSTLARISRPVLSSCNRRSPSAPRPRLLADIKVLASDHAADPRRRGEFRRGREDVRRLAALLGQQVVKGLGIETVAGEDRYALAESTMTRRPAPPEVVVVHRGKVVMNERVRVDQFERRRERHHRAAAAADRGRRREREYGPDSLATGKQRVTHRIAQPRHVLLAGEAEVAEVVLDGCAQALRVGCAPVLDRGGGQAAGSGSWPGRSGSGSSTARDSRSTRDAASDASLAHSSMRSRVASGSRSPARRRDAVSWRRERSSWRASVTFGRVLRRGEFRLQVEGAGVQGLGCRCDNPLVAA